MRHAFRAVFWSFFGVRKNAEYAADIQRLKPAYVVLAAVISAAAFVAALLVERFGERLLRSCPVVRSAGTTAWRSFAH